METPTNSPTAPEHQGRALALTGCQVQVETHDHGDTWSISAGQTSLESRSPRSTSDLPSWRASELVMAGLALCMSDLAWAYASHKGIPLEGVATRVQDFPVDDPLRIGSLSMDLDLKGPLSDEDVERITRVVTQHCKIKNTLVHGAKVDVSVNNQDVSGQPNDGDTPASGSAQARGIQCAC